MRKLTSIFIGIWLYGCNLDKEIVVKLPAFKKELVTECYLERDKPIRVYLSETSSYFDTLQFIFINEANVSITQNGRSDTIPNSPFFDLEFRKFYNYRTGSPIQYNENELLTLEIKDTLGRTLKGTTQFLEIPDIDTIEVRYDLEKDSLAGFLIWINDFPGVTNYYRIVMNEDSLNGAPAVEFTFTDNGFDGKRFPIGTSNRFEKGKTMNIRIFHIEQAYYEYLRSISAASRANGNPFAQPATIKSPVSGGFGIFTTLNYREFKIPL